MPHMLFEFSARLPLVSILCLAFLALRYSFYLLSQRRALRNVPGPRTASWIWGQEWLLYHDRPGCHYFDWHREFGKVVKFTGAFGHQVLSITDPRAISFILGESIYDFPKPRGVRAWFEATLGQGILWVEGKDAHETQRRIIAPALSSYSVRSLVPTFYETSAKVAHHWAQYIDESSCGHAEIEVTDWAGRFALDTVGRAAFSYDLNCLGGDHQTLAQTLDGLTNHENKRSSFYMRALFWLFPSILSIGKKGEMIRQSKKELGDIATTMWRDAKIFSSLEDKSFMSLIRAASMGHEEPDEDQMVAQMRTVISAAYEPVSAIIAWSLYELSVNHCLQQQVREEVSVSYDPSLDELNARFPLLDAFLKETFRLHPPILENHREAQETITVPLSMPIPGTSDNHIVIPKGTLLAIPVNVVQSDPDIWGPDATHFRPSRWLEYDTKEKCVGREMLAFSAGPRSCIGKTFALCEIKALIITLLKQFSFSCPYDIEPFQSFVIRPRIHGEGHSSLPLRVRRIDPEA